MLTRDNLPGDSIGGTNKSIIEGTNADGVRMGPEVVSYMGLDPRIQSVFYLTFGDGDDIFNSHYFKMMGDENSLPASGPLSSPTATYMSSITSTATTISTSSSSSSSTATSTSTLPSITELSGTKPGTELNSVSAGEIAGIVIGGTLGPLLLVGALGLLVRKTRKGKKAAAAGHAHENVSQHPHSYDISAPSRPQQPNSGAGCRAGGRQTPGRHHPHLWRHEMVS